MFALGGVLLGSAATYLFEARSQAKATKLEDDRRWLSDRRSIYASFLRLCESLLEDVDGVASMMSYDGDKALADEVAAEMRSEVYRYIGRWQDELQPVLCEVQLMASPSVSDLADRASGGLLAATGPIEG